MGTVKDICWISKYRKPLSKPRNEEARSIATKLPVRIGKNNKSALRIKPKKQESCHSLAKKLVDSLHLLDIAQKGPSRLSLPKTSPRPSIQDLSIVPNLCHSPEKNRSQTSVYSMCRDKKTASCPDCPPVDCCMPICNPEPPVCPAKPQSCPAEPPKCPALAAPICPALAPKCPPETPKCQPESPKCPGESPKCPGAKPKSPGAKPKTAAEPPQKGNSFLSKLICCEEPRTKRKKVKGKKGKMSSISVMTATTKVNCCACCGLLVEYFQETLRLFCNKNDTRLSEIFNELCDVAGCLCNDCLNLLKKIFTVIYAFTHC